MLKGMVRPAGAGTKAFFSKKTAATAVAEKSFLLRFAMVAEGWGLKGYLQDSKDLTEDLDLKPFF